MLWKELAGLAGSVFAQSVMDSLNALVIFLLSRCEWLCCDDSRRVLSRRGCVALAEVNVRTGHLANGLCREN